MSENLLDAFWQMPPIASHANQAFLYRTLTSITAVLSLSVHLGLLPFYWFIHHPFYLWMFPPQIWRLVTCYLITGSGLSLLFDSYFLYHYLSQLEIGNPRFPRKADVVWYLMFISGTILVSFRPSTLCSAPCPSPFPSSICPDSALHPQLSRFLKMRKITPALRTSHHSQNPGWSAVWAWWESMDGSFDSQFARVVFIVPYISKSTTLVVVYLSSCDRH
ncbi:Derlin-like protein [Ilyonectria robusta]